MISHIRTLSPNIAGIIEYINSDHINYLTMQLYCDKFGVFSDYILEVNNQKEFTRAKSVTKTLPLQGSNWLVVINADKVGVSEIKKGMKDMSLNAKFLFKTSKYLVYKDLISSPVVKSQSQLFSCLYFGRLFPEDISATYNFYMKDAVGGKLDDKLLRFITKGYQFDPDSVCELFSQVKAGNVPKTEQEVIEMIGVGGNTPQAFTINLLLTSSKTERGKKAFLKKSMNLLYDLSLKYDYNKIYNFILNTLKGIIEIKELQISGRYRSWGKEIPETYNMKRVSQLKRFEYVILNKITLRRVLCLLESLEMYRGYNAELNLLQGLNLYISAIK